jgi:hypothetical protein
MRISLFFLVILLINPLAGSAQKCYPFDSVPEGEPSPGELERTYASADTSGGVDPQKPYMPDLKGIGQQYRTFVSELGSYLYDNGYEWERRIRYFQRIYFAADGKADYYLYTFRNDAPQGGRRELFEKSVTEYLSKKELDVDAKGRFAMCAPVVLKAPEEEKEE